MTRVLGHLGRILTAPHPYRARRPILGADFLAIEREARLALERACATPTKPAPRAKRGQGTVTLPQRRKGKV